MYHCHLTAVFERLPGNVLCCMSCIRRVASGELEHWGAGARPRAAEQPPRAAALRRAVLLLGCDGAQLFSDQPASFAEHCCRTPGEATGAAACREEASALRDFFEKLRSAEARPSPLVPLGTLGYPLYG